MASDNSSYGSDSDEDLDDIPLILPTIQKSESPKALANRPAFSLALPARTLDEDDTLEPRRAIRDEPGLNSTSIRVAPLPTSRARSADTDWEPLPTHRGPRPPRLALNNPHSATPVGSPIPSLSLQHAHQHTAPASQQPPCQATAPVLTVDLVSIAFSLSQPQQDDSSSSSIITSRCAQSLGVAEHELTFYELCELPDRLIPATCKHIGVSVRHSGFSLTAMEELLRQNKEKANLVGMVASWQQKVEQAQQEKEQHCRRADSAEADVRRLTDQLRRQDEIIEELRQRLKEADAQREALFASQQEVRQEYAKIIQACTAALPGSFSALSIAAQEARQAQHLSSQFLAATHRLNQGHRVPAPEGYAGPAAELPPLNQAHEAVVQSQRGDRGHKAG